MTIAKASRVLIVEDDFLVSEMIQASLERSGYTVVGRAADGLQAVEMAQTLRPDVVVMDLELPGNLDGIEAAQRIQTTRPTPIVVLTAYETPDLVERASAVGVGAYLTKPPNVRDMERAITISMARFGDLLQLRRLNTELQAEIAERQQAEEVRTRLMQGLMTLYDTSLQINAQSDWSALLCTIVERAAGLLGARMSELYLSQPGGREVQLAVGHNLPQDSSPPGQDLARRVAVTGQAIMLDDYRSWEGRAAQDENPFRRVMSVPLKVGERSIGVINIADDQRTDPFGNHEFWLASLFADQAAVAIENTRLYEELSRELAERKRAEEEILRHNREQQALNRIGQALVRLAEPSQILHLIYEMIGQVLDDRNLYIALHDEASRYLSFPVYTINGQDRAPVGRPFANGLTEYVIRTKSPLLIPHQVEAALAELGISQIGRPARCLLAVPMCVGDQVLGVIAVQDYEQEDVYNAGHVELLATFASQAAIALENARLYQAVLDERSRLQALIESSHDGIVLSGMEQRILVVNAPALQLLGLPGRAEDWLGRTFGDAADVLRPHAPQVAEVALAELSRIRREDESPGGGEFEAPPYTVQWQSLPVRVGAVPLGRLIVFRDVTHERAVERLRQDMAHMMVHDLRGPLGLIVGTLELLIADAANCLSPDQYQALKIAYDGAQKMTVLVNDILDVTRLEEGQMRLQRAPTALSDLVANVLHLQSPVAASKDLRLESDVPSTLPLAWADIELIGRVLQNLIGNACKFTPPGGVMRVVARVQESGDSPMLVVSVSDTGPGIPDEIRDRLFQKFAHGQQEGHGSGLGLAFCRLAVEAHGGHIWVESTPGHGTTFTFSLPTAPAS